MFAHANTASDVTLYLHSVDCKNEEHHSHALSNGCYLPGEAVKDAFKATAVEIQSTDELTAVLNTIIGCETGCGKSATDSTRSRFQTTDGTIYNARSYYSYLIQPSNGGDRKKIKLNDSNH